MSPNPVKDQNTGVLAGTGGEAVVKGAVPQSQGGPLVGDMTVLNLIKHYVHMLTILKLILVMR